MLTHTHQGWTVTQHATRKAFDHLIGMSEVLAAAVSPEAIIPSATNPQRQIRRHGDVEILVSEEDRTVIAVMARRPSLVLGYDPGPRDGQPLHADHGVEQRQ